jgi:drug/metabolite transporter (DMT)-like permease
MNYQQHKSSIFTASILAVLATLIWSGNFIIARSMIEEIPPIALAFYRWLLATVILLPFAWKNLGGQIQIIKKRFWYFFFAAVTGVSMFNTFVYIAGHYTTATNMALLGTSSAPVLSVILAGIFLKEKITLFRITGMLVCMAGILLLLSKGDFSNLLSFRFSKGDMWVMAAALSFAIYNILVKKKPAMLSSVHFLFIIFLLGTVILLPFYLFELKSQGVFEWTVPNMSAILYLGLGASVISFLMWNKSIAVLGAGRAALFGNLIPVFSGIEAVWLLNEKITSVHIISFILVVAGLVVANFKK